MKYLLTQIFLSALLLCQYASGQNVRTIFLIRHAEKNSAAPDAALSPSGERRAECLARMLKDSGIKQIYVSDTKATQQTAAPLANGLQLTPTIMPAKEPNKLIRELAYSRVAGNLLVVGEADRLPFVLARLKAGTVQEIGENEYDRMFAVSVTEGSAAPVATLRYCDCGPVTAPTAKPGTPARPAPKKIPTKKP